MIFNTLLAYFLFGCTSVLLLTLMAIWVRRLATTSASVWFSRFVWALTFWAGADVLELVGPTMEWSQFWYGTVRSSAVCVSAICWGWFCVEYCNLAKNSWIRIAQRLLTSIGILLSIVVWTPAQKYLFKELVFAQDRWLWEPVSRVIGPIFDIYFIYGVSCSIGGLVLLSIYIFRTGPFSRWQVITLTAATAMTSVFAILTGTGRLGIPMLDKTVFALPVMVMALMFSLRKLGFLQATPLFLNSLVNAIPDGILALDKRGFLVEANQAGLALTQAQSRAALFQPVTQLFALDSALAQLASELPAGRHEIVLQENAGRKVYCVDIVDIAYRRAKHGTLMIFRDETLLRQSLEDLDAYSYRVAHDLKNPLSAILNSAELIPMNAPNVTPQELRDGIADAVDSMNEIIHELLLVAAIRDGDTSKLTEVSVLEVAKKILERSSDRGAKLRIESAHNWITALGRPAWIEEILTNLIANAIEHSPATSGEITLRCEPQGDYVEYSVSDNGCGIDETLAEDLFGSPNPSKKSKGPPRGFGLSIARRLAEKQGGTLGVRSIEGRGATFWFTMRIAAAQHHDESEPVST